MTPPRRTLAVRTLVLLAAAAAALAFTGCGSDDEPKVAARVGETPITVALLDAATDDLAARSGRPVADEGPEREQLREQALRQLVLGAALRLEAKERGLTVTEQELSGYLARQSGNDPLAPPPSDLARQQAIDRLTQDKLRELIGADVEAPSAAEVARFYEQERDLISRPAARAAVILRASERAPLDQVKASNPDLTGAIGTRGDVAGGQLTYVANDTDPALDGEVMTAKKGTVIGPRLTATGDWALIQPTEERVPALVPTLAQSRRQIADLLRDREISGLWSAFIEQVIGRYQDRIEIAEHLRPAPGPAPAPPGATPTTTGP